MGVFFRNSNVMSPVVRYSENGKAILSYISIGGTIEIYFIFKGGPKAIINQYQNLVGLPSLPPFWALGWHTNTDRKLSDLEEVKQMV